MIDLPKLFEILKKDKKNKEKDKNTKFMRHTLPTKERTLCFHIDHFLENFCNTSFQISTNLGLVSIGIPR